MSLIEPVVQCCDWPDQADILTDQLSLNQDVQVKHLQDTQFKTALGSLSYIAGKGECSPVHIPRQS